MQLSEMRGSGADISPGSRPERSRRVAWLHPGCELSKRQDDIGCPMEFFGAPPVSHVIPSATRDLLQRPPNGPEGGAAELLLRLNLACYEVGLIGGRLRFLS